MTIKVDHKTGQLLSKLGIPLQQVFTWQWPDGVTYRWDIDKAKELAKDSSLILPCSLDDCREALRLNHEKDFDMDYVMTVDYKKPGLVIHDPRSDNKEVLQMLIIDGWHRMMRCVLEHRTEGFQLVHLTTEQERQCRL